MLKEASLNLLPDDWQSLQSALPAVSDRGEGSVAWLSSEMSNEGTKKLVCRTKSHKRSDCIHTSRFKVCMCLSVRV